MEYKTFLDRIIDDGIAAARRDYKTGPKLEGAIAGFEACRGKLPNEVRALFQDPNDLSRPTVNGDVVDYWYWRIKEKK